MYGCDGYELTAIMRAYGCIKAYNVDGGGSSTIVVRSESGLEVLNSPSDGHERGVRTWEDRVNGYFSGRYGHFVSYMVEFYGFRGGAHGINTMTPVVFDRKTGDIVPEEAFFADGYREPVSALIQAHLSEALEGDEEALAAVFEPTLLGPNGLYELTKDGVTWYYQPYDIAPYYLGVISITVPWKELKPYVR